MSDDLILKVRVRKQAMGAFPFDIFYIVQKRHEDLIPRIFPWSLTVRLTQRLKDAIEALIVQDTEVLNHNAPRQTKAEGFVFKARVTVENCHIVVPILPLQQSPVRTYNRDKFPRKTRPRNQRGVAYLTSPKHVRSSGSNHIAKNVLDDSTTLNTPKGPVKPVCIACPRHLRHVQGDCSLGGRKCYEELILQRRPDEQLSENDANGVADTATHPE